MRWRRKRKEEKEEEEEREVREEEEEVEDDTKIKYVKIFLATIHTTSHLGTQPTGQVRGCDGRVLQSELLEKVRLHPC